MNNWEPVDFRNGQQVVKWPDGFNPQLLPIPEYNEGDRVQFVRDETCAREGTVRQVLFQGDMLHLQHLALDADAIIYIVTARGHDHRIKASSILGRFVSLERLSRIFPPQDV
ncbi:MAG TPA: hypothetical protein DHW02_02230 [Ktedonobacter sp.]|nr:hypothetical protein [Ktedonobacter sp.]